MYRLGFRFPSKNNSAEDGIDETNGLFRRNFGCSAVQKTPGIPFRTIPRKRKVLGIPYRRTKIEAISRNSIPNHYTEEKTTLNSDPWNKKKQPFEILFRAISRKRKQRYVTVTLSLIIKIHDVSLNYIKTFNMFATYNFYSSGM
jgi:hypothetical protein